MAKAEISTFIERMEEIGDIWEEKDVKRVYGDWSLEDALKDRMRDMFTFGSIIDTVLNRRRKGKVTYHGKVGKGTGIAI